MIENEGLRSSALSGPLFEQILQALPDTYQTVLQWTRYLPLDVVLDAPWDVNAGCINPLERFEWTTHDPHMILNDVAFAVSRDVSLWPFAQVSVPLRLLAHTISIPRMLWQAVPEYVSYLPIADEWCKAFLVPDESRQYGLRPMEAVDVRDKVATALKNAKLKWD